MYGYSPEMAPYKSLPTKHWSIAATSCNSSDRLSGPVVRLPGSRGPGFDSRRYQIFCVAVGLQRGTLSLVKINDELLERKVAAPV
jgi:hypothetical protein